MLQRECPNCKKNRSLPLVGFGKPYICEGCRASLCPLPLSDFPKFVLFVNLVFVATSLSIFASKRLFGKSDLAQVLIILGVMGGMIYGPKKVYLYDPGKKIGFLKGFVAGLTPMITGIVLVLLIVLVKARLR
jgi:cytochrome b subunit of formate dehydrogenase